MWTAPAYFAAFVVGHGSVLYPPTRNAIDSTIAPWKGATIGPNNDKYVSVPSPLLSPLSSFFTILVHFAIGI